MDLNYYGPGRPPLPETMETMTQMVEAIRVEPGIRSAKLAKQVGLTSLQCSTLAKRLEKRGFITITRDNRTLTYKVAKGK